MDNVEVQSLSPDFLGLALIFGNRTQGKLDYDYLKIIPR
jgi:hypothetical protein